MNRFKCPRCGGEQYTAKDTAKGCIFCGHQGELEKMLDLCIVLAKKPPAASWMVRYGMKCPGLKGGE